MHNCTLLKYCKLTKLFIVTISYGRLSLCRPTATLLWSNKQSVLYNSVLVRVSLYCWPSGGETRVLMRRKSTKMPRMMPSLLIRSMSVIFTAFADLTRNITDILQKRTLLFLLRKSMQDWQAGWRIAGIFCACILVDFCTNKFVNFLPRKETA
jgi:hypothetical protein